MRIEELYQDIIITVCNVTGIDEADILHSNREECADARYLLVMALSKMMTDEEIGRAYTGPGRVYLISVPTGQN